MFEIPNINIGEPIHYGSMTVFPLSFQPYRDIDYLLAEEAIKIRIVTVSEISDRGSVPELSVENLSNVRVLLLEGEELVGAKQNRIINTSILLPAMSRINIPVSCVERGRWSYNSRHFSSEGRHSSSNLRHSLKSSVSDSLNEGSGHYSNQNAVWAEIDKRQTELGLTSNTSSMADSFTAYQQELDHYADHFQYAEGTAGLSIAIGNNLAAIELFDNPATCKMVWKRLLHGFILDIIGSKSTEGPASRSIVEDMLTTLRTTFWKKTTAVGDGEEFRAKSSDRVQASVLTLGNVLVHGSLLTGV